MIENAQVLTTQVLPCNIFVKLALLFTLHVYKTFALYTQHRKLNNNTKYQLTSIIFCILMFTLNTARHYH